MKPYPGRDPSNWQRPNPNIRRLIRFCFQATLLLYGLVTNLPMFIILGSLTILGWLFVGAILLYNL